MQELLRHDSESYGCLNIEKKGISWYGHFACEHFISDVTDKLRAEQGRLSVRAIILLRDNLSPEQLVKAREFILERGRERGRMRRGGMGPGGERPTPPPDGSAPRDKPFAADKQD